MNNFFRKPQRFIPSVLGASAIALIGTLNPNVASAAEEYYTLTKEYDLNFDKDVNGNDITRPNAGNKLGIGNQWKEWGVDINANVKGNPNKSEPLLLFNSNSQSFTGGDKDLRTGSQWGTEEQGNVLIIQEDGWKTKNGQIKRVQNADDPDDEANGGWISFDFFDGPVNFKEFSLLDMDDDQDRRGNYLEVFLWDKLGQEFKIDALNLVKSVNGKGDSYTDENNVTITQNSKVRGDNSMYTFNTSYVDITKVQYRYPGSGAIAGLKWEKEVRRKVPESSTIFGTALFGFVFIRSLRKGHSAQNQELA